MALIIKTFARNVPTAGAPVPVSQTRIFATSFLLRAREENVGKIFIGDAAVNSTNGIYLLAGEAHDFSAMPVSRGVLQVFDLSKIYITSAANGDGVIVEYVTEER